MNYSRPLGGGISADRRTLGTTQGYQNMQFIGWPRGGASGVNPKARSPYSMPGRGPIRLALARRTRLLMLSNGSLSKLGASAARRMLASICPLKRERDLDRLHAGRCRTQRAERV